MKWASVYHPFFKSFHRRQIYCALYHHRSTWHIGVTHGATRTRRRSASSPLISRAFRPCPGASASSASAPLRNGVVSVCWLYSAPVAFMSPLSLLLPLLLLLFLLLLLTCLIWFDFFLLSSPNYAGSRVTSLLLWLLLRHLALIFVLVFIRSGSDFICCCVYLSG